MDLVKDASSTKEGILCAVWEDIFDHYFFFLLLLHKTTGGIAGTLTLPVDFPCDRVCRTGFLARRNIPPDAPERPLWPLPLVDGRGEAVEVIRASFLHIW